MKYQWILVPWSYAVVLTECTSFIKLFLHLMRALLLRNYDKLSLFFSYILLIRNHMIFLEQFGINKHLSIFSKTNKIAQARRASAICGLWKNINAYLFQIALEIIWLPILKCNVNCARSYLWRRLRALHLNSAIVSRKALALWKYNEFVLTNHGARISLNFLETLVEHALSTNDSVRYVRTLL